MKWHKHKCNRINTRQTSTLAAAESHGVFLPSIQNKLLAFGERNGIQFLTRSFYRTLNAMVHKGTSLYIFPLFCANAHEFSRNPICARVEIGCVLQFVTRDKKRLWFRLITNSLRREKVDNRNPLNSYGIERIKFHLFYFWCSFDFVMTLASDCDWVPSPYTTGMSSFPPLVTWI